MTQILYADHALLPDGWANMVRVAITDDGRIDWVKQDVPAMVGDTLLPQQLMLPAMSNIHSHAFQRAMAGLSEYRGEGGKRDNFWSWRVLMYRFLEAITPTDAEAIAALVQMEMLEAGFGSMVEFHYLHHQAGGVPYDDVAEMTARMVAAAAYTGIGLTHLPVYYAQGGVDGRPLQGGQQRFGCDIDQFASIMEAAAPLVASLPDGVLGIAPHSLRAVSSADLQQLIASYRNAPVHMHIAEQTGEVSEVQDHYGARPVEWLLANAPVDAHWCLIHATHMNEEETRNLARSGAVAGLCPITEANLGDGFFPALDYLAAGGKIAIGSDSNIRISLIEELRALEYSQRLLRRERAVLCDTSRSVGRMLYDAALAGGAQAAGRGSGAIEAGKWADICTLDLHHIDMAGRSGDEWLDSWIFAGDKTMLRQVFSAGRHVVRDGAHIEREAIMQKYRSVAERLALGR